MAKLTVHIAKEYLKFSAAHFTIFDDTSLERLHGHNYYVALDVEFRDSINGLTMDFRHLKRLMEALCEELDEKIVLPSESKYLKIAKNHDQFDVQFIGAGFSKTYSFPCEDVELLPVNNITSEMLAKYLCDGFSRKLEIQWRDEHPELELVSSIISAAITVEETRGQSVKYTWEF